MKKLLAALIACGFLAAHVPVYAAGKDDMKKSEKSKGDEKKEEKSKSDDKKKTKKKKGGCG